MLLSVAMMAQTPQPKATKSANRFEDLGAMLYLPKAGDKAFLVPGARGVEVQGIPVLEPQEETFREFVRATKALDDKALVAMVTDRKMVLAKPGTRIEIIDPYVGKAEGDEYAVSFRFLEGPMKGQVGWTSTDWLFDSMPTINGMSYQRHMELKATAEKMKAHREATKLKNRAAYLRSKAEADRMIAAEQQRQAAVAAQQAEIVRQNTPDYMAVTRDRNGQVSSIYTRMPNGSTSFRTRDGYVSDTQVIRKP